MLPTEPDAQFRISETICAKVNRLADRGDPVLFERERGEHGLTPPKAIDDAIVSYVRLVSGAAMVDPTPT
jgi:hypothetical protein